MFYYNCGEQNSNVVMLDPEKKMNFDFKERAVLKTKETRASASIRYMNIKEVITKCNYNDRITQK